MLDFMPERIAAPQRRETSQRKAKSRGTMEQQMYGCIVSQADDMDEPAAFVESGSDWAPSKVQFFFHFSHVCLFARLSIARFLAQKSEWLTCYTGRCR